MFFKREFVSDLGQISCSEVGGIVREEVRDVPAAKNMPLTDLCGRYSIPARSSCYSD